MHADTPSSLGISSSVKPAEPLKILFVCLGNICRSPAAEGIAQHFAKRDNLPVEIDSAGMGDWHVGQAPHGPMRKVAAERGIPIDHLRARQVDPQDLFHFDYVIALDHTHLQGLQDMQRRHGGTARIRLLCPTDVPDPYYGELEGFYSCFEMIDGGVRQLFVELGLYSQN